MPERSEIILHAGFHETGHDAIQNFVRANFSANADIPFIFADQLGDATRFAREFSKSQNLLALSDLIEALDTALSKSGPMIVSAEDLSGNPPGASNVRDYTALLTLIPAYVEFLNERFPNASVLVVLVERYAEDWLFEVFRTLVIQYRMRLTFAEFQAAYFEASQLADFASVLQELIHPVPLRLFNYDSLNDHPLGIGGGFLEALGFNVEGCKATPAHERPADLWHECLRLNRSTLTNPEVRAAKDALLKA